MTVPADAPLNSIAWNSFGYVATRTDNGSLLESAEPQKVGLQVIASEPAAVHDPALHAAAARRRCRRPALTPT